MLEMIYDLGFYKYFTWFVECKIIIGITLMICNLLGFRDYLVRARKLSILKRHTNFFFLFLNRNQRTVWKACKLKTSSDINRKTIDGEKAVCPCEPSGQDWKYWRSNAVSFCGDSTWLVVRTVGLHMYKMSWPQL